MLNWRDIQDRAVTFAHRFEGAKDEDKDAKSFWKELFSLYGVDERSIGSFEERVRIHGRPGVARMDFFAPKRFLVEQKSRGKDLAPAYLQALDYFSALEEHEKPRYIVVSDFEHFHIYDLEAHGKKRQTEFLLKDLPKHVKKLAFLADEETEIANEPEAGINVRAVYAIGKLHKALRESNYTPEHLAPLLTRLVFCFFADDTQIFENNQLRNYLLHNTKEDGSDIGAHLGQIFAVLDMSPEKRQSSMHAELLNLPYVNGGLFAQPLNAIFASREVRDTLMQCFAFDWSGISPEIFGSMFQSVMDEKERHDLGAHYTSEKNIMKVIGPLFLDALKDEYEKAKTEEKLLVLWEKLQNITLLDPACCCCYFLVVAYRELRRLETEIIKKLDKGKKGYVAAVEGGQTHLGLGKDNDLKNLSKLTVVNMYGIELGSFPAEVAKLSLWLVDHMMNMELGAYYGVPIRKLPLTEAPHIIEGNALRIHWEDVVPKEKLTHILGNPPFLGSRIMEKEQKDDLKSVIGDVSELGFLDYVTGWYVKAAQYMQGTDITCAFVSTNSISQGEQVGILWGQMYALGTNISFAHRTFKWSNEAKGKAAVYCVIIGFGLKKPAAHRLFNYPDVGGDPIEIPAKEIHPYLIDAPRDVIIRNRQEPLCDVPSMSFGNMPRDGGFLILNEEERAHLIDSEPQSEKFIRLFLGAQEFLHGERRYCLWLVDAHPQELQQMPLVRQRIQAVKSLRELSVAASTRKMAATAALFAQRTQPPSTYILVPRHSSENRLYVPMGFFGQENILADSCLGVGNATLYHLGILESEMHMAWMRAVAGRLKSDYRYSKDIVYNNFPWPEAATDAQKKKVEECAQAVLDARAAHPGATLADLYDPLTMPKNLLDAHKALDRAVDACYGTRKFTSEPERLEFLFERYKELTTKDTP